MTTSFPFIAPKLRKGSIVVIDQATKQHTEIPFQYNSDTLTRRFTAQTASGNYDRSKVAPMSSSLKRLSCTEHPIMVQRYKVPGSLDCGDVVDWMNNNSPYAPEWAQTGCTYSFNGQLRISPPESSDAGGVKLTVKGYDGLTVSVNCPIDHPEWTPSARPNRDAEVAAWKSMRAILDAHEQQHKKIGEQWRTILQQRFRATNFTVEGTDKTDAMDQVRQRIADDQQQWQANARQAQDAIDPFRGAQLNCP